MIVVADVASSPVPRGPSSPLLALSCPGPASGLLLDALLTPPSLGCPHLQNGCGAVVSCKLDRSSWTALDRRHCPPWTPGFPPPLPVLNSLKMYVRLGSALIPDRRIVAFVHYYCNDPL